VGGLDVIRGQRLKKSRCIGSLFEVIQIGHFVGLRQVLEFAQTEQFKEPFGRMEELPSRLFLVWRGRQQVSPNELVEYAAD
jgi:hypothetical protein